jgi:hypothetical protein
MEARAQKISCLEVPAAGRLTDGGYWYTQHSPATTMFDEMVPSESTTISAQAAAAAWTAPASFTPMSS